jgi:hypothetical protein
MKKKNELAKIALTALVLASAAPAGVLADSGFETTETIVSKGCGKHCKAFSKKDTEASPSYLASACGHGGKKCGGINP